MRRREQRRAVMYIGSALCHISGGKRRRALPARRKKEAGIARPILNPSETPQSAYTVSGSSSRSPV